MAFCHINDDREFMQGLYKGLGQAIAIALKQQQDTSQAQLQHSYKLKPNYDWKTGNC